MIKKFTPGDPFSNLEYLLMMDRIYLPHSKAALVAKLRHKDKVGPDNKKIPPFPNT